MRENGYHGRGFGQDFLTVRFVREKATRCWYTKKDRNFPSVIIASPKMKKKIITTPLYTANLPHLLLSCSYCGDIVNVKYDRFYSRYSCFIMSRRIRVLLYSSNNSCWFHSSFYRKLIDANLQLKVRVFVFLELLLKKLCVVLALPCWSFVHFVLAEFHLRYYYSTRFAVTLCSHELRVRILRELIMKINLAKNMKEKERESARCLLVIVTERKDGTCILRPRRAVENNTIDDGRHRGTPFSGEFRNAPT